MLFCYSIIPHLIHIVFGEQKLSDNTRGHLVTYIISKGNLKIINQKVFYDIVKIYNNVTIAFQRWQNVF